MKTAFDVIDEIKVKWLKLNDEIAVTNNIYISMHIIKW